jgi:hypothetical protein
MVMFHDDDMMHPDYVETMFPFIQKEGVSAVGCMHFHVKMVFQSLRIRLAILKLIKSLTMKMIF